MIKKLFSFIKSLKIEILLVIDISVNSIINISLCLYIVLDLIILLNPYPISNLSVEFLLIFTKILLLFISSSVK